MTTKTTWAAAAAATAIFSVQALAGPASAECHMRKLAELPVTMEGLRPIVHLKVNGVDAALVVDTGSFHSVLTPAAAQAMKVKGEPMEGIRIQGAAAQSFNTAGRAELDLGGAPIRGVQFVIGASNLEQGHAGLIGQNVFSLFDVEYDFANGVVRLFDPKGCGNADLGYWANGASVIPIEPITEESVGIFGKAKVNDHSVRFEIDTGAPTSMLTTSAAKRVGMVTEGDAVTPSGQITGIGGGWIQTSIAPAAFEIGYESLGKTRLRFGKIELDGADMVLGDDFMLSHRVLVSNLQHKMYFTYNGGPVFQLKQLK